MELHGAEKAGFLLQTIFILQFVRPQESVTTPQSVTIRNTVNGSTMLTTGTPFKRPILTTQLIEAKGIQNTTTHLTIIQHTSATNSSTNLVTPNGILLSNKTESPPSNQLDISIIDDGGEKLVLSPPAMGAVISVSVAVVVGIAILIAYLVHRRRSGSVRTDSTQIESNSTTSTGGDQHSSSAETTILKHDVQQPEEVYDKLTDPPYYTTLKSDVQQPESVCDNPSRNADSTYINLQPDTQQPEKTYEELSRNESCHLYENQQRHESVVYENTSGLRGEVTPEDEYESPYIGPTNG